MNYSSIDVVMQEVPNEISLCISIVGCPFRCSGCHSPNLWKPNSGIVLTIDNYNKLLESYKGMVSCVLFMGGEWHSDELIKYLKIAKNEGLKTCLYSGAEEIEKEILNELTWVKIGRWVKKLGGLDSKTTNQQFIEVKTNSNRNELFQK